MNTILDTTLSLPLLKKELTLKERGRKGE